MADKCPSSSHDMPLLHTRLSDAPIGDDGTKPPARRASKACEACRVRKIRCVGGLPCDGCRTLGREHACRLRKKARPNRALPARLRPFPETTFAQAPELGTTQVIESEVRQWVINQGLRINLDFEDSPRISSHILEPMDVAPISELISKFVNSSPHHLDTVDRNRIETLYNWSCALPGSLTNDQLGLLYACLCRATCMGEFMAGEDGVRFFRVAYNHLELCQEPSMTALSALLIMVGYAAAHGGRGETISLLERTADQIRRLGLDKREIVNQYDQGAQVDRSLFSHYYMDVMVSTVTGSPPKIFPFEITVESESTAIADRFSRQVLRYEAELLEDWYKKSEECGKIEYILQTESRLANFMKDLQSQRGEKEGVMDVHLLWAGIRAHWLQIMLRVPVLRHPTLAVSSYALLTRSSSYILRAYRSLASCGFLNPCWLQMRRILTCIHIVILTHLEGSVHNSEVDELLTIGIELVQQHERCWEPARRLGLDLQNARAAMTGVVLDAQPDLTTTIEQSFAFLDTDWMSWLDAETDWGAAAEIA